MAARDKHKRPSVAGKKVVASKEPFVGGSLDVGAPTQASSESSLPYSDASGQGVDQSRIATKGSAKTGTPRKQSAPKSEGKGARRRPFAAKGSSENTAVATSSDGAAKTAVPRKKSARKGLSRRFLIASLSVIAVLVIVTGVLAWNHWLRYDDAADIQGTWVIDGSQDVITITGTDMVMTAEVSYPYALDTFHKTISFSFEQYSGNGSYAFSPERDTLVITETDADTGEKVSTKLVKQ